MQIRTDFPHKIREIENTWIPLADGTRLAARIWMPEDATARPVPALLEYLPYRKDDGTVIRDARRQPYLAGHGYAAVRVDMRGSGDSDGILQDEYLPQEQDDALEVLSWIAAQPWCDGNIGMHGISWGGFNSLQVAARQPPELKAILVIGFTDDRYNDDVHYMGGCVLASQMMQWAGVMFAYNAAPPDPHSVGQRWREMWLERMEKTPPYLHAWLRHQRRDEYWKHGSVGETYSAIRVPVLAVGGWADSYNNSIPRLLSGLEVPRMGLIGPWSHAFPEWGPPGPRIGFLQESLRWWDHWLKGIDNGLLEEPVLRSWIQQREPPARHYAERKGYWVADPAWPSPHISKRVFVLNGGRAGHSLDESPVAESPLSIRGLLAHGFDHPTWASYGSAGEYPGDQRLADGQSLNFTSSPLAESLVLLGDPQLELELTADQPLALVAVRLCDVAPDGASVLVSWGLLNLTHRESHAAPSALEAGKRYAVKVPLNFIGYEFSAGHRLRIGISPTYARQAWPSPRPVTLTVFSGAGCRLTLPVRSPQAGDGHVTFPPAEIAPPLAVTTLRPDSRQQTVTHDQVQDQVIFRLEKDSGRIRIPNGMEVDRWSLETHSLTEGDPLSMEQRVQSRLEYRRADWRVRIETDSYLRADETHFHLSNRLDAFEGDEPVFTRTWTTSIQRDLI